MWRSSKDGLLKVGDCSARDSRLDIFFERIEDKEIYVYMLDKAIARYDREWIQLHSFEFLEFTEHVIQDENPFARVAVRTLFVFICLSCGYFDNSLLDFAEDTLNLSTATSIEYINAIGNTLGAAVTSGAADARTNDLYESWLLSSQMCKTQEAEARVLESLCRRIRSLYLTDIELQLSDLRHEKQRLEQENMRLQSRWEDMTGDHH